MNTARPAVGGTGGMGVAPRGDGVSIRVIVPAAAQEGKGTPAVLQMATVRTRPVADRQDDGAATRLGTYRR
ncbi:hypothetical protein GCM10022220_28380 [Actinocatenispora rupis]|uniref:Uncharacterized protein n=1 Tax=Actinocatenispora rupis TaxID=519421 RepID=A0A8J3J3N3_9ACTN|nr:hypothetical protein Aru02nite_24040 [Actinocatenispora rupis]